MPLILQPASVENVRARTEVQLAAYADDAVVPSLMPGLSYEQKVDFFSQDSLTSNKPWIKDLEIIDTDTGRVAAYARWKYPTSEKDVTSPEEIKFPPGTNVPLCEAFFAGFTKLNEKYLDTEKMYFLNIMVVHPDYQRRGLAQRLMEQALKDADRDGAQTYLSASDAGKFLYRKYGFETVEEEVFDLVSLGASATRRTSAQIREPRGKDSKSEV